MSRSRRVLNRISEVLEDSNESERLYQQVGLDRNSEVLEDSNESEGAVPIRSIALGNKMNDFKRSKRCRQKAS